MPLFHFSERPCPYFPERVNTICLEILPVSKSGTVWPPRDPFAGVHFSSSVQHLTLSVQSSFSFSPLHSLSEPFTPHSQESPFSSLPRGKLSLGSALKPRLLLEVLLRQLQPDPRLHRPRCKGFLHISLRAAVGPGCTPERGLQLAPGNGEEASFRKLVSRISSDARVESLVSRTPRPPSGVGREEAWLGGKSTRVKVNTDTPPSGIYEK